MIKLSFIVNKLFYSDRSYKVLFWLTLCIILFLALTPRGVGLTADINDKVNHVIAFFVLAFLGHRAYSKNYCPVLLLVLPFGLFIEAAQYLLPYRDFSLFDMLANTAGIAVYLVLIQLMKIMAKDR